MIAAPGSNTWWMVSTPSPSSESTPQWRATTRSADAYFLCAQSLCWTIQPQAFQTSRTWSTKNSLKKLYIQFNSWTVETSAFSVPLWSQMGFPASFPPRAKRLWPEVGDSCGPERTLWLLTARVVEAVFNETAHIHKHTFTSYRNWITCYEAWSTNSAWHEQYTIYIQYINAKNIHDTVHS